MQLLFRHKLLLGATPCNANGAGSSRGFWPQASSPSPGLGAYVRNINKCKRNLTSFGQNQGLAWSSDSSLWGNQVQNRNLTSFGQNQGLAWSSDSSLWGNQVLKKVLDRTKALHGPRTQAYGETNYLKEKRRYMNFRIHPRRTPR